jgi:hypothetical protein
VKAAKKRRLGEPFTNAFKAMPLEIKNANAMLVIAEDPFESYGNYFYGDANDHRFSQVELSGTRMVAKLKVDRLYADGATPVAQFPGNDLYLVFATTEQAKGKYKITSSDHLHIRFAP